MKWSAKFHDVLMKAEAVMINKSSVMTLVNSFWHGTNNGVTLKLNSLNANILVGCVYMADGNNLHASALSTIVKRTMSRRQLLKKRQVAENVTVPTHVLSKEEEYYNDNDDLTQITSSSISEPFVMSKKGNGLY